MTSGERSWQRARLGPGVGFCVLIAAMACAVPVAAHPISVVVESAYVESDKVTIDVEVFAEDLYYYHGLKPNEQGSASAEELQEAAQKHGPLLLERLPVFQSSGRRIEGGRVASVEGDEFAEDIPLGELMGHDLVYRLELPLSEPPEFLSFSQRLVDADAGFPALVDFRVKQAGQEDEVEATLKPGSVRTVRFAWTGEPAPDADASREAWMTQQREDSLGATALNTVRSFLYINRREVRHELLIPFPLLETFFTVDRAQSDFLSPNEQETAKPQVADYFRAKNPLEIDGERREPTNVRVEFFTLEDRDLTQIPKRRTVSAVNARVGVILAYELERPASEVQLKWNSFSRDAWRVDAFCFAGDEVHRPKFSMATRTDTFVWKRPAPPEPLNVEVAVAPPPPTLSIPWLSFAVGLVVLASGIAARSRPALAGGILASGFAVAAMTWNVARLTVPHPLNRSAALSASEADAIFRKLHGNLYLAADAGTDEEALTALAATADGELLRELYLQLLETFREADDTGSVPVNEEVSILAGRRDRESTSTAGFDYSCRWEVTARTEHWGHVHNRRYQYDAVFRLEPRAGRWTMTAMNLRDARLVEDNAVGLL